VGLARKEQTGPLGFPSEKRKGDSGVKKVEEKEKKWGGIFFTAKKKFDGPFCQGLWTNFPPGKYVSVSGEKSGDSEEEKNHTLLRVRRKPFRGEDI